ncbi:MAG: hypothetical protein ACFFER_00860 [Candidatus Thorarchaeota archaeon]
MDGKISLSSRGVAHYPPQPILGNESVCMNLKMDLDDQDSLITLVGHWGAGKTHFGYRVHFEVNAEDLKENQRQITRSEFAKNALCFYVSLGMMRNAKFPLSFDNVLKTGIFSLCDSEISGLRSADAFQKERTLLQSARSSCEGIEEHIESIAPEGVKELPPLDLLRSISNKFGIKTFVFVVDEIEEIEESERFGREDLEKFIKDAKHFSGAKDFSMIFLLLISDAEWKRYKGSILEEGPRARRNIEYHIELPDEDDWLHFIEQREVPEIITKQTDTLASIWNICGRNYGWFEVMLVLFDKVIRGSPDIINERIAIQVETLISKANKQGRDLLNLTKYQPLIGELGTTKTAIVKTLLFSGHLWTINELGQELDISSDIESLIEEINLEKKGSGVEPIQKFIQIEMSILDAESTPRIDDMNFHRALEKQGGCPILKNSKVYEALIATPSSHSARKVIPLNHSDFGARMRWIGMGEFDLFDIDAEKIHTALKELSLSTTETYVGLSWWWMGELIAGLSSDLPSSYLPSEKSNDIENIFQSNPGLEDRAILRGFAETIKSADLVADDSPSDKLKILTTRDGMVVYTEQTLKLNLRNKGGLLVDARIAITRSEPEDLDKLNLIVPSDGIAILLTPSEKQAILPDRCVQVSFQDYSLLSFIGIAKDNLIQFDYLPIEETALWNRLDLKDRSTVGLLGERRHRLKEQLRLEDIIYSALNELSGRKLCIFPLVPKMSAEKNPILELRSPVGMSARMLLLKATKLLSARGKVTTEIDTLIGQHWSEYSPLMETTRGALQSVQSVISSEAKRGKQVYSISLVDSSVSILDLIKRLGKVGNIDQASAKIMNNRLITTASVPQERSPSIKDVIVTHLRFLICTGHLIQRNNGELELVYEEEESFLSEVIRLLKDTIDEVEEIESSEDKGKEGTQLLGYLRISSKEYLNPWLNCLQLMKSKLKDDDYDTNWITELREMLPRFAYLIGGAGLSDIYSKFFDPIKMSFETNLADEDIAALSKSISVPCDADKPFTLLASAIGNLVKDFKETKRPTARALVSLINAAKSQLEKGATQVANLRNSLDELIELIENAGFGKDSALQKSLGTLQSQLETAESKLGGGNVEGFFSDLKSVEVSLSLRKEDWKLIEDIMLHLKDKEVESKE